MKMQDVTIHSQNDKERIPTILRFVSESGFIFTIHRHMYYPGTWLISSNGICDNVDLNTDDLEEAKKKGFAYLKNILEARIRKYEYTVEELDKLIK